MPYKSEAQRRKFHAMAERGQISKATVAEWDKASEGLSLPDKIGKFGKLKKVIDEHQAKSKKKG